MSLHTIRPQTLWLIAVLSAVGAIASHASPIARSFVAPAAIIFYSVVPGFCLLSFSSHQLSDGRDFSYAVGLSLCWLMILGIIGSLVATEFPIPGPLTHSGSLIWFFIPSAAITAISRPQIERVRFSIPDLREVALLLLLPFITGLSVYLSNSRGWEEFVVAALALIALSLLVISRTADETTFAWAAWIFPLTILIQAGFLVTIVYAGDAGFEQYFGMLAIETGGWPFEIADTKTTSLRLTILNPAFAVFAGESVSWAMRVVYPLQFSVFAPALYHTLKDEFDSAQVGFLSVILYSIVHPFITVLSSNTRSGSALLFIVLTIAVLLDSRLDQRTASGLMLLFSASIVASHYGYAPLFLFIVGVAWGLLWLERLVTRSQLPRSPLTSTRLVFLAIVLPSWYLFSASGYTFDFIVNLLSGLVVSTQSGGGSASAGGNSFMSLPSFTFLFIQIEYLLLLSVAAIGVLIALSKRPVFPETMQNLSSMPTPSRTYLALAAGAAWLVPLAFLPLVAIGIARILMIVLLFLAPFTILALRQSLGKINLPAKTTLVTILVVCFAINSGLVGHALTGDIAPQPTLSQDTIHEEDDRLHLFYLHSRYTSESDLSAAYWMGDYAWEQQIYGSASATIPPRKSSVSRSGEYRYGFEVADNESCDGYVYLSEANTRMGHLVQTHNPNFVYYGDQSIEIADLNTTERGQVYNSGHNRLYTGC